MSLTPLRTLRLNDARRPSQVDLANMLDMSQVSYLRLERGERSATPEVAEKLAKYFGVTVGTIFTPARYSAEPESATSGA